MGNTGALIITIRFWGPLYYIYSKEPPQNSIGNYFGSYTKQMVACSLSWLVGFHENLQERSSDAARREASLGPISTTGTLGCIGFCLGFRVLI